VLELTHMKEKLDYRKSNRLMKLSEYEFQNYLNTLLIIVVVSCLQMSFVLTFLASAHLRKGVESN
jgi:hypothetical protein